MNLQRPRSIKDIVRDAVNSAKDGLFKDAEDLYTNAIKVSPNDSSLYEGRSSVRIQLHRYEESLHDAEMALELDPEYVMGYFRQGVALQCLGDFAQAIVSFSEGIVRDQKNPQLLNAIIEVALDSPIKSSLEPVMSQLRKMHLDTNPFIITSVIGQELLSHNHTEDAVQVLENAVAIGTRSLKLKGSVFSALSSALWSLGDTERAIHYMKEDLTVSRKLSDNVGECRAHGNLGAAYYSQQNYQLAKENHNRQLALAQTMKDEKTMASAFSSLGHVYTAISEHKSAAESHKQSAAILRQTRDTFGWCKQLELVATSYLLLSDLDSALQWQLECLRVSTDEFDAESQEGMKEEAKARVNLASIYHKLQRYTEEISCLEKSVEISRNIHDTETEAQTLSSLGYITRHTGDLEKAQSAYERLLELALSGSNQSMEAKACANLGVIHHQIGDYEMALKLQARNLELSLEFRDVGSQGRAHGNIGNAYSAMGMYEQAIQHHLKELEISSATSDKASECTTHGNLAVAYQALKNDEKAFHHYSCQLSVASDIGDITNETRACMNLANFHSSRKEYTIAIEVYKKYLKLSENGGIEKPSGIAKACYNIGFAYFSLRDYINAINFYERSLKISLDTADTVGAARVYCNLGLAWKAYGDSVKAFECQNLFLAISNQLQSMRGVFKALGNMGDIHIGIKQPDKAINFYQQQYTLAQQNEDDSLKAQACAALGAAHRIMGNFQKALEYHSEELQLHQELKDAKSEFRAHGHLGAVLTSLGEFSGASKCYENQCYIAKQIEDLNLQSTALGNMGITSINMQDYDTAIDFFERQLLVVESLPKSKSEKGRVICNIADCYEALENYNEAITLFEEALECVVGSKQPFLLERVYRGLSSAHKLTNNVKESFKYCQLRIQICKNMNNSLMLAEAYGEMGYLFTISTNFEKALSCLKIQMKYAGDNAQLRGDAVCGLGSVYKILRNLQTAVDFHQLDLQIAVETNNVPCQGRAHGNLGAAYEALHDHTMAVKHQEQHLFIADSLNDSLAKLTALRGVARNVLRLGNNHQRASLLLQQALLLARELGIREDEGKVMLDLALCNYVCGNLSNTEEHLHEAMNILMQEFWKSGVLDDVVNVAVHPNQCIDLYEEIMTCQSALACLYVHTHQHAKAIESAEKLRHLPEFVIKKQQNSKENLAEKLKEYSTKNEEVILYYSINAGNILTWVVTPEEGLCGFTQSPIFIDETNLDKESPCHAYGSPPNLLSHLISELRDSLGLETPPAEPEDPPSGENERQDSPSSFFEDVNEKENFEIESDINREFQMYRRLLTTQTEMYLSKNLSTLDLLGQERANISRKPPIFTLYELLISGIIDKIQKYASKQPAVKLVLVLEGELLHVPFSLLKKRSTEAYLSQQFDLQVVASAIELLTDRRSIVTGHCTRGVVIGNPIIHDIIGSMQSQASEDEANMVASFLKVEPLVGKNATKSEILHKLESTECLHLACSVSTTPPCGIYLSPNSSDEDKRSKTEHISSDTSNADSGIGKEVHLASQDDLYDLEPSATTLNSEQLEQRLMSSGDIINLDLSHLKLVVFGSAHLQGSNFELPSTEKLQQSNSKLVQTFALVRSFFIAGVKALLLPLWPVPETVCKILTQSFYARMMSGTLASEALNQSIHILRNSEQFEHPSYWAGFVLIGQDMIFDSKNLSFFHALWLLIKSNEGRFHDVIRLLLHLIDKSLERMDLNTDSSVPMYAAQASISKKVQNAHGWREIFSAVGFELRSGGNGIPDAVFFPKADKRQELLTMKTELITYLQLSNPVLTGINRLLLKPPMGCNLKEALHNCIEEHGEGNPGFKEADQLQLIIQQKIWRTEGCSELLTGLGFGISQIGEENVMLHCSQGHRNNIWTTLQLLDAFFGEIISASSAGQDLTTAAKPERQSSVQQNQQQKPGALSNMITRGLPPSTRRSIAVDFGSSFKSQSSLDSLAHLELSDHMTKPFKHDTHCDINQTEEKPTDRSDSNLNAGGECIPKNFVTVPSSDDIVVPTPIFPQTSHLPNFKFVSNSPVQSPDPLGKRSHSLRNIADASDVTKPVYDETIKNPQQSHTIQRSKRFQFHGSQQATRDTLEIKVPRSPQKSPMFYRKDDNANIESPIVQNEIRSENLYGNVYRTVQTDLKTDTSKHVTSGQTETQRSSDIEADLFLPEKRDNSPHFSPNILCEALPQIQSEIEESTAHFVPIISSETTTNANFAIPSNIVYPKPKRLELAGPKFKGESSHYIPGPSVAQSLPAHSQPFDYSHIVDKLTRLSTSDVSEGSHSASSPPLHVQDTNNNFQSSEVIGKFHRNSTEKHSKTPGFEQAHSPHHPNTKVIGFLHSDQFNSPHGGAGLIVGRKNQLQVSKINNLRNESGHMYSRSLDSAVTVNNSNSKSAPHKHTLSQDGAPPPPYKHPDFIMSPRRSSGDIAHSRTSSHASHSSAGSIKSSPKKQMPKFFKRTKSDQSFSDSEGSHVSYQLETANQGKTWLIHENMSPQLDANQVSDKQKVVGTEPIQYQYEKPSQEFVELRREDVVINQRSVPMQSTIHQHKQRINQALQSWHEPIRNNAALTLSEQNQPVSADNLTAGNEAGKTAGYPPRFSSTEPTNKTLASNRNFQVNERWSGSFPNQTNSPLYQPQFANQSSRKLATNTNFSYRNMQFKPVKPPKPSHLAGSAPKSNGTQPTSSNASDKQGIEEKQIAFV